ncbi:MAG: hypothetical protein EBS01_16535, partial [Verrucomicrobia bacterium]|nr:hypothetical protein [Verrucomicrobiota bacterium]
AILRKVFFWEARCSWSITFESGRETVLVTHPNQKQGGRVFARQLDSFAWGVERLGSALNEVIRDRHFLCFSASWRAKAKRFGSGGDWREASMTP